jgi:hypothetical protein
MQPSLLRRLLSTLPSPAALWAAAKGQPLRTADEFSASKLRVPPVPPAIPSAAFGWPLEDIRSARADQIDGHFRRPVQLAVAMRTHGDLYTAYRVRTAPLAALGVEIVPAGQSSTRGAPAKAQRVAARAEVLFGEPGPNRGAGLSQATVKTIVGDLANHGIAIGYNIWTDRPDGSGHDLVHKAWPLEFVHYDSTDDQLYTQVDPMMTAEERAALEGATTERGKRRSRVYDGYRIPINHADGRWTIYRLAGVQPWRTEAALLAAAITWASAAYADRDWNRGSTSHGNTKILGQLPEGTELQQPVLDDDGKPTGEVKLSDQAEAMMDLLEDFAGLEQPFGVAEYGAKISLLTNASQMWQVWKELGSRAQQLAALIYTGTTAYLGVQSEGPGVNVEQLMDVGMPIVQGDKAAQELGFHEGVMVPWTARNYGDSSLAPQRLYQLPDVDAQQNRDNAAKNEEAFSRAYKARQDAGILTQEWADEYADRLGVPRVQLAAPRASGFALAPTDLAKIVDANEGRSSIGLEPKPDGDVPISTYGLPVPEPALVQSAALSSSQGPRGVVDVTAQGLIDSGELPPIVTDWLQLEDNEKAANNPPGFVTNEACWNKAKRAASHAGASDFWAFATWWYLEHC